MAKIRNIYFILFNLYSSLNMPKLTRMLIIIVKKVLYLAPIPL